MCETKAILLSLPLFLLVAASFCIYQAHTENKVGNNSKIISQVPCENQYKRYCLNAGECYYLFEEYIVGCNCSWLYGRKQYEKYIWWDWIKIQDIRDEKILK